MSAVKWRVWMRLSDGQLGVAVDGGWMFEWVFWEQPYHLPFQMKPERRNLNPSDFKDLGEL